MKNFWSQSIQKIPRSWLFFFIIILLLGFIFRCANLGNKIYWVDEVATSIRISGYTKQEVIEEVSKKGLFELQELQNYQRLSPDKNFSDTINALIKSPEHAPLYFIIARFWIQVFGSNPTAIRSLSVILSLLALPCFYWLCQELFKSPLVGWVTVSLVSVSPFYVSYAQEARPYSLWIVAVLLSNIALLKALRLNYRRDWIFYLVTIIIGLYTSLLTSFIILSHSIYVFALENFHFKQRVQNYLIAVTLAILVFSPWLWIVFGNWQRLQDNTTWMRVPIGILAVSVIWFYSTFIIFIESPIYVAFDPIIVTRALIDLILFALVLYSLYFLCRHTSKPIWLFILTQILVPIVSFRSFDLVTGGQGSTAIRYMVPIYIGIQLSVAYLFVNKIYYYRQAFWKKSFIILILVGLFSCIYLWDKSPRYQKTRNIHNPAIASSINQTREPILLAEPEQTLDLISMSYSLNPKVKVQVTSNSNLSPFFGKCNNIFLFNPSPRLQDKIKQEDDKIQIEQIYKPKFVVAREIYLSLWKAKKLNNSCRY